MIIIKGPDTLFKTSKPDRVDSDQLRKDSRQQAKYRKTGRSGQWAVGSSPKMGREEYRKQYAVGKDQQSDKKDGGD